jgi:hypothetical protein
MLNDVLVFLKNSLNAYLSLGGKTDDAQEDQVVFLVGQSMDMLNFKLGAISAIMINFEQENILRPPDRYARTLSDGAVRKIQPEIRLNLYVLFVAHYQQYEDSLRNLSTIIQYFQGHRTFSHQETPELSEKIEQLVVELVTLSFAEQNEVWGSLRLPYHPSVLYKVKMVIFQDEAPKEMPEITDKTIRASSL